MANPVDLHVGHLIRQHRKDARMSQQTLAGLVGIRFQQIQKYESGLNRVSASRLWAIARALDVPVSAFFDGLDPDLDLDHSDCEHAHCDRSPGLDLLRCYLALPEEERATLDATARALRESGSAA